MREAVSNLVSKVRYGAQEKRYGQKKKSIDLCARRTRKSTENRNRMYFVGDRGIIRSWHTYERRFDERNTAYASPLLNFDAARAVSQFPSDVRSTGEGEEGEKKKEKKEKE